MPRHPALQDAPFTYYNGAYFPARYSSLGAWVKYRPGPNEVKVLATGTGYVHIACPDRELMLTRDALSTGAARQFASDGWHEFVPFSWSNSIGGPAELTQYMTNYAPHVMDNLKTAHNRAPGCVIRDRRRIMADSGGFQVASGKAQWLNPDSIGKWYATNADEGTTLDLPGIWYSGSDLMRRAAKVQNLNSRAMLKHLPDDFSLFDVIHGLLLEDAIEFNAIASKGWKTDRTAIGGVYSGTPVQALYRLASIIMSDKIKKYDQYHILGVYNVSMLCPLIRFAALLRKQGKQRCTITTDASTHVYSATNRTLHLQRIHRKPMERLNYSHMATLRVQNPHRLLACGCIACSTLKYADVISHVPSSIVPHIALTHNAVEIDRWTKMMTEYAMTLDKFDYAELAALNLAGSAGRKPSLHALALIEDIFEIGIEKAAAKRQTMIGSAMFTVDQAIEEAEREVAAEEGGLPKSMFETGGAAAPPSRTGQSEEEVRRFEAKGNQIISTYEKYHKTGAEPALSKAQKSAKRTAATFSSNSNDSKVGPQKKKKVSKAKQGAEREAETFGRHAKNRPQKIKHSGARAEAIKLFGQVAAA